MIELNRYAKKKHLYQLEAEGRRITMRKKVLITRNLPGKGIELIRNECELLIQPPSTDLPREELLQLIPEADALICLLSEKIDREVLEKASRLKVISNYAVGYNNIDVDLASKMGIYVTNTPDVLTEATADLAWALLFAAARRVVEGDKIVREGHFTGWAPDLLLGAEVYGKTLGVIGLGRIGEAVAKRARGFDMKTVYWSRERKPDVEKRCGLEYHTLEELLKESDFISLNVALTPETNHFISKKEFSLMKKNAILINTARGPVVDEEALVKALKEGQIKAAGLDVFEKEPKIHPGLLALTNVVMAPHVGSGTEETRSMMSQMVAENVLIALKGKKPPHAVNIL